MQILPKDNTKFQNEHIGLDNALRSLKEDEMVVLLISRDELRKTRSAVTSLARKYNYKLSTRFDNNECKLYIAIEGIKEKDFNVAIELLSRYDDTNEIVEMIKRKKDEIH